MLPILFAIACTPTNPNPYGNGKYDTAEPSSEVDSEQDTDSQDTEDTQDTQDTQDTEDTEDTEDPVDPNAIEILGLYNHQGNEHLVGETSYSINYGAGEVYSYAYIQFSNPQRWLVAVERRARRLQLLGVQTRCRPPSGPLTKSTRTSVSYV